MKGLIDPRKPTAEDVERHNMHHMPYRNWCLVCVQARGRDADHRKEVNKERGLSEYCFDYCLPGDEFGQKLTVLVGRERVSGMKMVVTTPTKASTGQFGMDCALELIESCGDGATNVITRSDKEPSIQMLVKDLVSERTEGQTVVEESPVGSSGCNGVVERAVQEDEGDVRALLMGLEGRVEFRTDAKRPILTFLRAWGAIWEIGCWSDKIERLRWKG